ncbi:MAG: hypothetical protein KIY12_03770 [Thermoplasmata archaeon]|uniref:Uncharacterized protein n=1 Tax=Candidatus Sysuiplasma superficiale TaxID=2823368 RepID=A0A8J8CFZ5_9ARCH|nr:hypothetical protein [Candidatus Sysuiplasma superficiale]
MAGSRGIVGLFVVISIVLSVSPFYSAAPQAAGKSMEQLSSAPVSTNGAFALVSYFTNGGGYSTYGWVSLSGPTNRVDLTSKPDYFGEPSLQVPSGTFLVNTDNVTQGDQFVSFQAAVYSNGNSAFVGLVSSNGEFVSLIEVKGDAVFAGEDMQSLGLIGYLPQNSVYPAGWSYVTANVFNSSTSKQFMWTMQVFVDGSSNILASISTPAAYQYSGIVIGAASTSSHLHEQDVSYFTDIIFTSYQIPIYLPGYNPMEGYGQGSGLLVNLLPAFTILHADMVLGSWNVPETGILSFQINAMNYYGTTRSSCVGFFQLGVDIDPNGHIAPWYVEGTNCIAHYFLNSNNPAVQSGFYTPPGTLLSLSIVDQPSNGTIFFQIVDYSATSQYKYWNATIPYTGTAFYSTYTQLEFQPSSTYPIQDYYFNGTLYSIAYGNSYSTLKTLNGSYMLPFILNAPPSWSFAYYDSSISGYQQIG